METVRPVNRLLRQRHLAEQTGQILGTAGEIGYMITDLGSQLPTEAVDALRGMDDTIRLRVLERRH